VSAAYDGRQFVGIDLHRRRSVVSRTDQHGKVLEAVRISNGPHLLAEVMGRAGEQPEVVLEATYGWYWAADLLATIGANVHLAHPLGVKAFAYRRVRNDFRDAADLADLLPWVGCRRPGSPHPRSVSCGSWCAIAPSWSRSAPAGSARCMRFWPPAGFRCA
jgi:transposase